MTLFKMTQPLMIVALLSGCANHYVTPAAGVTFDDITESDFSDYYAAQPVAPFPANIAVVRVQDAGYRTRTAEGYGQGRFTTVTTRDIEEDEDLARLSALPLVRDVAPLGRILLPPAADTIRDLRAPAAKLRADLLLVYSIDTAFTVEGKSLGPLSLVSLGFLPNHEAQVTATVSGMLVDVRTGFIYGTAESTAKQAQRSSLWSTELAVDSSRLRAEGQAFDEFVGEFEKLWKGIVDVHAATTKTPTDDGYFRVKLTGR